MAQNSSAPGWTPAPVGNYTAGVPEGQQAAEAVASAPQVQADKAAALAKSKAETSTAELAGSQANDQVLQRLIAPALTNPEVAANPQWQKMVSDKLATTGLQLPKGQDGNIDLSALSSMAAPLVKPNAAPGDQQNLLQFPAGPVREAMAKVFNPSSVDPAILNAPMVPSQQVIKEYATAHQQGLLAAQEGKIAPAAFIAGTRKDMLPYIGTSWGEVNNDKLLVAGMGQKTEADIQKLVDAHLLTPIKAAKMLSDIQKNTTVDGLNEARTKYLGVQAAGYDSRTQAIVNNSTANSQRAQAYVANVSQRITNSINGSWTDRAKLMQTDKGEVRKQLQAAYTDSRLIGAAIATAQSNGTDPTTAVGNQPSLTDQLAEAQSRIATLGGVKAQIDSPALTAGAAQGQLNAVGGAGVSNSLENAPGKPSISETRVDGQGRKWNKMSDGTIVPAQ
jgi:protein-disulfide isomerase-like protein with CxxC motif